MIRTVVYTPAPSTAVPRDALLEGEPPPATDPDAAAADKYADKLLKYIPAEVIAFYTPIYAYVKSNVGDPADPAVLAPLPLAFVLIISIVGVLGYLVVRRDPKTPPRWYFYALAAVAFVAWAIGTSTVGQDVFGFPEWWDKLILLVGIFLIPLIDELIPALKGLVGERA